MTTPRDFRWTVIDSSGWVEYMGDGPKADEFEKYFVARERLLLPSIIVYEVYKKLSREGQGGVAQVFLSQAYGFGDRLIALDLELSLQAAEISLQTKLPMADAIIYAAARRYRAEVITTDAHFSSLPGVRVV